MANIKTAISIQEHLFQQAGTLARDMKLSRSRLFAVALEEFIKRHHTLELLDRINEAYDETPEPAERKYRKTMKKRQLKLTRGQW